MKTVNTIVKILAALAAITGIVYVIATYGDKIVAWTKKLLDSCPFRGVELEDEFDEEAEVTIEEPVAEDAVEEAPVEETVEEVVVEETDTVADEADFAE